MTTNNTNTTPKAAQVRPRPKPIHDESELDALLRLALYHTEAARMAMYHAEYDEHAKEALDNLRLLLEHLFEAHALSRQLTHRGDGA